MMNAVAGRSVPSVEPSAVSSSVPFVSPHQWEQWLNVMPLRAWLRSRPADCVAAQCVDAVLEAALGPLRVVVCTESASVPLLSIKDTSSGFSRGIHIVDAAWPVTQGGVDLAVLVHSSEMGARTKARMAAGPMLFTHCESAAEVPLLVADLLRSCPDGDLLGARQRVLHGEVRAIAYRFPEVADALEKTLAACGPPPPVVAPYEQEPVLAVIGPDPATTTTVALQLRQRWQVADKPHAGVDVVIAAAPPQGWGPHDTPTLADAMAKVGRVVSTAALPTEAVPGIAVAQGSVEKKLADVVARPPVGVMPMPEAARWMHAAERADQRAQERLRAELSSIERLAGRRYAAARDRLVNLCEQRNVEVPPPLRLGWRVLVDAPVVTVVSGGALFRLVHSVVDSAIPGLWLGGIVAFGLVCGAFRLRRQWVARRQRWCSLVISILATTKELDSTSYQQRGVSAGGQWIRLKLSGIEKQHKT